MKFHVTALLTALAPASASATAPARHLPRPLISRETLAIPTPTIEADCSAAVSYITQATPPPPLAPLLGSSDALGCILPPPSDAYLDWEDEQSRIIQPWISSGAVCSSHFSSWYESQFAEDVSRTKECVRIQALAAATRRSGSGSGSKDDDEENDDAGQLPKNDGGHVTATETVTRRKNGSGGSGSGSTNTTTSTSATSTSSTRAPGSGAGSVRMGSGWVAAGLGLLGFVVTFL